MNTLIEPTMAEHISVAILLIAGIFAVLRSQPKMKQTQFDQAARIGTYWANGGVILAAAAVPVALWILAGRALEDLGISWGEVNTAAVGLTVFFVAWYTAEAWWRFSGSRLPKQIERWQRDTPFMPTNGLELAHFSFLALAAGVGEEIIFRGFLIHYVAAWTGTSTVGLAIAVTLPAIGFALSHLYQGWRIVAFITGLSVVFGAIFVVTGSLLIPMVLHTVMDIIGGILAVRFVPPIKAPAAANETVEAGHAGQVSRTL